MTLRSLTLVALLLLAACEKTPNPVQSGKSAAASAASHPTRVVTALSPGLWQTDQVFDPVDFAAYETPLTDADRAVAEKLGGKIQTGSMCVSANDARSPYAPVIAGQEAGQCNFESFSLDRGTLDAVIACVRPNKPGRTLIVAHGNYSGTSFALDAVVRVEPRTPYDTIKGPMPEADKEPIRLHARITGRYKGACPAGEDVAQ
jgi:hypothetical protein